LFGKPNNFKRGCELSVSKALTESLEDYLEAIFHIISEKQVARVKDISKWLNVNMSSVTGALHSLADRELINYTPYEVISLTREGKKIAKDVIRRHEALRDFFVKVLSVDDKLADETACKMEHALPQEILKRFIKFIEFAETCPRGGAEWLEGIGYHCKSSRNIENCERCR
jgi:DtxR family Mn-dependent transcriptional regulator